MTLEIKEALRSFVRENFYVPDDLALSDDASLLEQGIVDSTGVLELVTFIEDHFAVTIDDAEMVPQNLDSIASISTFISRKKA